MRRKQNKQEDYSQVWMVFVNMEAMEGYDFMALLDFEELDPSEPQYQSAWANILIRANNVYEALEVLEGGLKKLCMRPAFIESIQNLAPMIENNEVDDEVIAQLDELLASPDVFRISDQLFPYE